MMLEVDNVNRITHLLRRCVAGPKNKALLVGYVVKYKWYTCWWEALGIGHFLGFLANDWKHCYYFETSGSYQGFISTIFKCDLSSVTYKVYPLEIHCFFYFIDAREKNQNVGYFLSGMVLWFNFTGTWTLLNLRRLWLITAINKRT